MTFDLTADAPGDWAFHCHNLYHMTAGMMRVVTVRPAFAGEASSNWLKTRRYATCYHAQHRRSCRRLNPMRGMDHSAMPGADHAVPSKSRWVTTAKNSAGPGRKLRLLRGEAINWATGAAAPISGKRRWYGSRDHTGRQILSSACPGMWTMRLHQNSQQGMEARPRCRCRRTRPNGHQGSQRQPMRSMDHIRQSPGIDHGQPAPA